MIQSKILVKFESVSIIIAYKLTVVYRVRVAIVFYYPISVSGKHVLFVSFEEIDLFL